MRLITLFVFLVLSPTLYAQSWQICNNGKVLLKTETENEEKNKISLDSIHLSKKGLTLQYNEGKEKKKGWERVIAVYDSAGKELKQQKGNSLQLSRDSLHYYLKNSPLLKFFTWSLPTDPKLKALVRVRRIHLATISQ
ncbi:MAG TPA: hypothetical protein VJ499_14520 [Flavisolibacter sp.]|nr:hypothetical protein [Flavisolibacter sp.]